MSDLRYNLGFDMETYIQNLPAGLERAVLRALVFRVGQENAISRYKLLALVKAHARNERDLRLVINQLRKDGFPICSTGGKRGGYWLAGSAAELDEYMDRELKSRIKDQQEQLNALTRTRKAMWGEGLQGQLF